MKGIQKETFKDNKNKVIKTGRIEKRGLSDRNRMRPFHVLVVDDEYLIRYMVSKALSEMGISVEIAENGRQAQKKILVGNYDLVITDLNMPELDGAGLLRWLMENRPYIERIVMTGYDFSDLLSQNTAEGIVDYLSKPFPVGELREAVKRSMERILNKDEKLLKNNE